MTTEPPASDSAKPNLPEVEGYNILQLIGRGRTTTVWKALHISSGREVAVKILSENFSRNPNCVNCLKFDLKLLAGLKHDSIVKTHEVGQSKITGCYYLVSEYVSGYSLGDWLRRSGRLAESDALAITHFTADALRVVWNKTKLIHGDIKPDNIMIDNEGTTKVIGFGLEQSLRMASASDAQNRSLLVDTLPYMSPEMFSGQAGSDCRSDIYSLGATLYHLLTGKTALTPGESAAAGATKAKPTPHSQEIFAGLTIGSARLIKKMMAKAPGERYQKWEEVIAELTRLELGQQEPVEKAAPAAAAPVPAVIPSESDGKPVSIQVTPSPEKKPAKADWKVEKVAKKKPPPPRPPSAPVTLPVLKKPATSFNKTLRRSLYIAAAFHGLLLLAAGTLIVSRVFYNRETTFVGEPPPLRAFEPRKLEHKVKVQKRQRSSSRPSMAPRLVSRKESSSFALPEIKVDSKSVKTSFSPKFTTVSGVGMGVGLGTGYGLGGFGEGVSTYDFFGIKGRADRVAILMDVSLSMIDDIRGGEDGYKRVKDKIGQLIDDLSEQALFNVIVFADAASACSTNLMIASLENKQKAKEWLAPFNTKDNVGLSSGNLQQSEIGLSAIGGETRLDLALTGAFEQGADTILIISDGLPRVRKALTEQQRNAWEEKIAQWERENEPTLRAQRKAQESARRSGSYEEKKVWVPGTPATKAREGSPARAATEGHWETRQIWTGGGVSAPQLTPKPVPPEHLLWWTLSDFIEHFTLLYKELYEKKGKKKPPVIHVIGYCIDDAGSNFLKGLSRQFKGNYRRVGDRIKTDETGKSVTKYPATIKTKKSSRNFKSQPTEPVQPTQPGSTKPTK